MRSLNAAAQAARDSADISHLFQTAYRPPKMPIASGDHGKMPSRAGTLAPAHFQSAGQQIIRWLFEQNERAFELAVHNRFHDAPRWGG